MAQESNKYLDAINKNNEAYKNFMEFMAQSIETLRNVQNNYEAIELSDLMRSSLSKTRAIVFGNINGALDKELVMPEGQPTFAPDYANRRGYKQDSGYDGNIDAENNPSLHSNY